MDAPEWSVIGDREPKTARAIRKGRRTKRQRAADRGWLKPSLLIGAILLCAAGAYAVLMFKSAISDATIVVLTDQRDAEVTVDGRNIELSAARGGFQGETSVKPGTHLVEVKKDGFSAYREYVPVALGERFVVPASLSSVPTRTDGVLEIEATEPDSDVYVDSQKVAVSWTENHRRTEVKMRPGTHWVEVKKRGFSTHGESVVLSNGERKLLQVTLAKTK
jgi:hypothetical protein